MYNYKVLLIENNGLMLERLSSVIHNAKNFELVARYTNPRDALGQAMIFKPNLILLDADQAENITLLATFREKFAEDTAILCLSTQWDAQAASQMVRFGADGYLIKPFTVMELIKAVETFRKKSMGNECEVLAFFSPKGKSGKTTLIANMALSLAKKTGENVAIIDADLQFGDMAVFFNLTPASTIVEAVRDINFLSPVTLKSYFVNVSSNVYVLCGTRRPEMAEQIKIESFMEMVKMARSLFRYILIDLRPAFNPMSITAAELADKVYLVAMYNDGFEIKHMKRALEIFRDGWSKNFKDKVSTVFTRVEPLSENSKQQLEEQLGYPITAIISNAYTLVSAATNNGHTAVEDRPDSKFAASIDYFCDIIRGKSDLRWEKI